MLVCLGISSCHPACWPVRRWEEILIFNHKFISLGVNRPNSGSKITYTYTRFDPYFLERILDDIFIQNLRIWLLDPENTFQIRIFLVPRNVPKIYLRTFHVENTRASFWSSIQLAFSFYPPFWIQRRPFSYFHSRNFPTHFSQGRLFSEPTQQNPAFYFFQYFKQHLLRIKYSF